MNRNRQNVILGVKAVPQFSPGDRVKLTSSFLRSTGQFAGGEGSKRWTVRAFDPVTRMVTTDELREDLSYWTPEELEAQPDLKYRRIGAYNLQLASVPG